MNDESKNARRETRDAIRPPFMTASSKCGSRSDLSKSRITSRQPRFCASRVSRFVSRILPLMTLATSLAHADTLIDPTRPIASKSAPVRNVEHIAQVTAIFHSGKRCVAVLDGKVVKAGDRIGDITIQEITTEGVRYARAGRVEFARLPKQAAAVRRDAVTVEAGL